MLIHHLKIAWRNLLKYKTQNIISILCLSVGVVCFAIVFQIVMRMAINIYYSSIDSGVAHFNIYDMTEEEFKNAPKLNSDGSDRQFPKVAYDEDFIDRLIQLNLPAMREVQGTRFVIGSTFEFDDGTDQPKSSSCWLIQSSLRRWHYLHYRSAITGKRIPEMKDGDILITDDLSEKLFGKGADPRGYRILTEIGGPRIIRDVLNVSERIEDDYHYSIILCHRNCEEGLSDASYKTIELGLHIEVAEGYTREELQKQLQSALPEYFVDLRVDNSFWHTTGIWLSLIFGIILLLGSSVLLIGVTGFLKMQIQLFSLRSREIALRRTMGAKPRHLFMLLFAEVIIVYAITVFVAWFITVWLANYAIPIVQQLNNKIALDVDLIRRTETYISIVMLVCSLVVVYFSVRRQLHAPVGLRVGRSGNPHTSRHGFMLGMQFVISMVLTFTVFGCFYGLNVVAEKECGGFPKDRNVYRNTITSNWSQVIDGLSPNPDVEHIGRCIYSLCQSKGSDIDKSLFTHCHTYEDGTYAYSYLTTDERFIDLLGIRIMAQKPTDERLKELTSAVYVPAEQVERLRTKWNLAISQDTQTRRLYNDRPFTLIGYAMAPVGYRNASHRAPSFWMVESDEHYTALIASKEMDAYTAKGEIIIFPKKGKYGKVEDAIADLYREAKPGVRGSIPCQNLYEKWFSQIRMIELMQSLCFLLVIVSLLCIVASVYSAISLECRGREKEVALRKIHGAHVSDIVRLFGSYYLRHLIIGAVVSTAIVMPIIGIFNLAVEKIGSEGWTIILSYLFLSFIIVSAITLTTIARKIYRVSRINPAEVIKKD